jgi:hypothetical protein
MPRQLSCSVAGVIPEIDIWRAAEPMLGRYSDKAIEESAARADELAVQDDYSGQAIWRRTTDAVSQLDDAAQCAALITPECRSEGRIDPCCASVLPVRRGKDRASGKTPRAGRRRVIRGIAPETGQ